jgi:hypothetical protein
MDVVTVAIVGLCIALAAAGLIVVVCGAIYLAIKRQATMVVTTLLLVVLLYVFAFWATQAANAIPNREPPRVGSDFGSMICNPSESSPSILVRGGLRLGGHDKVGMAGDTEMVGGLW